MSTHSTILALRGLAAAAQALLLLLLFVGTAFAQQQDDIFKYVDPLIGTTNGGHVFPGATLPFGMAKAVADVDGSEAQGGFASDDSLSELFCSPSLYPPRQGAKESVCVGRR